MATQAQLEQRVREYLYSSHEAGRPFIHQINGAINNSQLTMIIDTASSAPVGSICEFEDGEQVYVEGASGTTITIKRGHNGTTAASHSDNAVFAVNPTWTRKMITQALTDCVHGLAAEGVYSLKGGTVNLVTGQDFYELSETDVMPGKSVLAVWYQYTDGGNVMIALPFQAIDDLGGISGPGFHLLSWGTRGSGEAIRYLYPARLDAITDNADDPALEEIMVLGATYRLLAMAEAPRSTDPGRLTDRTVQPGQQLRNAGWFYGQYLRRIAAYRAHLMSRVASLPRHPRFGRASRWRWR